jgi:hypothetical protein
MINFPATTGQPTDGSFTHSEVGLTWTWKAAAEREFLAKQAKVNAIELGAKVSTSIDEPATTLEGQA